MEEDSTQGSHNKRLQEMEYSNQTDVEQRILTSKLLDMQGKIKSVEDGDAIEDPK